MKKICFLLCCFVLITSCSNDSDDGTEEEFDPSAIVGSWKLARATFLAADGSPTEEDFSSKDVVYTFETNGNLTVSNNSPGHIAGNYSYTFKRDFLSSTPGQNESEVLVVEIENTKWAYNSLNGTLVLSLAHIDGPGLFFDPQ